MILRTLVAILALQLLALVAGQSGQVELPAITGPAGNDQCGGCYVVADVAGVVFGSQQLTATQVEVVSVGVGKNGTNVTTTTTVEATVPEGQFTINSAGLVTGAAPTGFVQYGPSTIITVGGATLTSPTQYQVFSAYSVTSTVVSNGQCVAVAGAKMSVSPAFSVAVPSGAGPNFAIDAENSFIAKIGKPTCSAGGANFSPTTHTVVNTLTSTSTTVGPLAPITPQAISTVAPQTTQQGFIHAATSVLAQLSSSAAAARASAATTSVSVGTIIVVSNGTAGPSPSIQLYTPGLSAAPERGAAHALWAGAAAVTATLFACLAL